MNDTSIDTLDLVKAFFDSEIINYSVDDLTRFMVIIASALLPFFFSVNWVWSYAKHSVSGFGEKPKFFDKMEIIRGGLLWFIVMFYQPIFGSLEYMAFEVIEATQPQNYAAWKANHGAMTVELMNQSTPEENSETEPTNEAADGFSLTSAVRNLQGVASGFGASFISIVASFLGYIVSVVVGGLSYLISKIFYVIGPLAITFSVLPAFKDKLDKWFGTWLGITMNLLTLNLLTSLLIGVSMQSMESIGVAIASGQQGVLASSHFAVTIFNVIIIVMYVLSFWITSYIVGTSDAGKVLSTAVGMASSVAAMGTIKAAAVASKASSGPSTVADVLGSIQKTK